jgi:hypothetical protein
MDPPDGTRARDRSLSAYEESEWQGFSDEAVTDTEDEALPDAEADEAVPIEVDDTEDEVPEVAARPAVAPLSNPAPGNRLLSHGYDTLDELERELRAHAASALFNVRRLRSGNPVPDFGPTRVIFCCTKDTIRKSESLAGRTTTTRKTGCGWRAVATALKRNNRKWRLELIDGHTEHNHPPAEVKEAISTQLHWTAEQKAFVAAENDKPGVKPHAIAESLREKWPRLHFNSRQLANLRLRLRKKASEGYTPFQATMKLLREKNVPFQVNWADEEETKPTGLFWTHDFGMEQWKQHPWVQMYDNTYKTNNKNLAFFQVMTVNNSNKLMSLACALINNEREEGFDWLMAQVKNVGEELGIPPPNITITDFDNAMKNAVASTFPAATPQICIFHVNKNIVLNIKRKWDHRVAAAMAAAHGRGPILQRNSGGSDTQVNNAGDRDTEEEIDEEDLPVVTSLNDIHREGREGEVGPAPPAAEIEYSRAGLYKLWCHMIYAISIRDFEKAWATMKAHFADQHAILTYIHTTYIPVKEQWATCYTNKYTNFGHRTTSAVESLNKKLKTFVVNGKSTVLQLVQRSFLMVDDLKKQVDEARWAEKDRILMEYVGRVWLGNTPRVVASLALRKVTIQYRHMLGSLPTPQNRNPTPLPPCHSQFTRQYGIPCRHELFRRHEAGSLVLQKEDFHPY